MRKGGEKSSTDATARSECGRRLISTWKMAVEFIEDIRTALFVGVAIAKRDWPETMPLMDRPIRRTSYGL